MLLEEIRNIKSETSDLRKFGLTVGIVLGLLGGLLWWRGKDIWVIFIYFSAALIIPGLFFPRILSPLQKAWMTLAVIMGWFMTRVILSILFYLVFTSIGVFSRLFGKQFLDLKYNDGRGSYWIKRAPGPFNKSNYEKQF